jgi:hypothetical protein
MYWTYIPGIVLSQPGSRFDVTFDVVAKKTFSDGIRVHYAGEHLFGGPACTIVAT